MPIIPQHLQRENLRGTLSQAAGLHWHRARYHGGEKSCLPGQDAVLRTERRSPTGRAGTQMVALDGRVAAGEPGGRCRPGWPSRGDARPHRGQENQGPAGHDRRRLRGGHGRRRRLGAVRPLADLAAAGSGSAGGTGAPRPPAWAS
jgi:hypothetical protein